MNESGHDPVYDNEVFPAHYERWQKSPSIDNRHTDPYYPELTKIKLTEAEIEELRKSIIGMPIIVENSRPQSICQDDNGVVDYD